jgi:superfamily II DNA or RNA helicase
VPTDDALHIGHHAAMDVLHFQLEPAQLALKRLRQRILIADTVGLGKTLEAGILISELIARGKGQRILVVTVKSMMLQFQKELWNRFSIPLIRLDSKKIQKIKSTIPSNYNPFFVHDKTIISIDTLKQAPGSRLGSSIVNTQNYRVHVENAYWDIIVIDEAHNVATRGKSMAQRASLAELLATRSDTLIMLSATPHDGRAQSFASLVRMLDKSAIPDIDNYTKEDVGDLCIRRHRKDIVNEIKDSFKDRTVTIKECAASPQEEAAFDFFSAMELKMDLKRKERGDSNILFKTGLEKALFSSPAACIKSIEERLKKLDKSSSPYALNDSEELKKLKALLEKIDRKAFSRYDNLISLLKSPEYKWTQQNDDRIVIFTERIETMRFLKKWLCKDLDLSENEVISLHGGLMDTEQQKIVDEFGRDKSDIKILVASDVASEGINLHYLCHRLIHFDIPWSLMVFQQRNGRIDRYGQTKSPDIRYFKIESKNKKISGDVRILEILVEKQDNAYRNLGDPSVIMGKYNSDEEEKVTASAIENGVAAEDFGKELDKTLEESDPLEILMSSNTKTKTKLKKKEDETLFSDINYLEKAIQYFFPNENDAVARLEKNEGVKVKLINDLGRRLATVLPEEIITERDYLYLSPDIQFCLKKMKESFQNSLSEAAWPDIQYLWPLHPIFDWVNNKAGLIYKRSEAPLIGLSEGLKPDEIIFLIGGVIPNRKSTPVVSAWFALQYEHGRFKQKIDMEHFIERTGFGKKDLPNQNRLTDSHKAKAKELVEDVIIQSKKVFSRLRNEYKENTAPLIKKEVDNITDLKERRKEALKKINNGGPELKDHENQSDVMEYNVNITEKTLGEKEKKRKKTKAEELKEVDAEFEQFVNFVHQTLETEDTPYIRIIAAFTNV